MTLLGVIIMFFIGFITWSLAVCRILVLENRRMILLCGLVFTDELITMKLGMYLARSGTNIDAIACAVGGAIAAWLIVWIFDRRKNGTS